MRAPPEVRLQACALVKQAVCPAPCAQGAVRAVGIVSFAVLLAAIFSEVSKLLGTGGSRGGGEM